MIESAKNSVTQVRAAEKRDLEAIARLAGELGYPSSLDQVSERFTAMEGNPHHATFVAEGVGGEVVAWVHVTETRTLENDPRAEITGLVVDANYRSAGIGASLLNRCEEWARSRNLNTVGVRSNVIRDRAHSFYERLGYTVVKSQKVFRKKLI